jgi:hypothetical protein
VLFTGVRSVHGTSPMPTTRTKDAVIVGIHECARL